MPIPLRSYATALELSSHWLTATGPDFSKEIGAEAAPAPQIRRRHQSALYGIAVHIAEFLHPLARRPEVEIVESFLPDVLWRMIEEIGLRPMAAPAVLGKNAPVRSAASPRLHCLEPLHRDADRNSDVGIPAVVQVVAIVDVHDIDFIVVVPVISPVLRPGVNHAEPVAAVLEAGISAHNHEGQAVDAESMVPAEVPAVAVVGDAVAVVTPTLSPSAVVGVPAW